MNIEINGMKLKQMQPKETMRTLELFMNPNLI